MYTESIVIGYCSYCNFEIYNTDDYICEHQKFYHAECYEQKDCYYDEFDLDNEQY